MTQKSLIKCFEIKICYLDQRFCIAKLKCYHKKRDIAQLPMTIWLIFMMLGKALYVAGYPTFKKMGI